MTVVQVLSGEQRWTVEQGDCLELLRSMPDECVDSVVCDPPAGVSFMNAKWDGDKGGRDQWIAWLTERMSEVLRVLKPGGHALVWALPRTSHWTGMALESAGFEVRDRIAHLFGSGFPKSLDVSKGLGKLGAAEQEAAERWQGWGTALKPAAEDWWLVRKPVKGSIARNVAEHGTGAINVDGCRVPHASAADLEEHAAGVAAIKARGGSMDNSWANHSDLAGASDVSAAGRWPAHVLLTHAADCERLGVRRVKAAHPWYATDRQPALFTGDETSAVHHSDGDGYETIEHWRCGPSCPVGMLDEQSGELTSGIKDRNTPNETWEGGAFNAQAARVTGGDTGGASRYFTTFPPFFYTPKCDRTDREKGCEYLPRTVIDPQHPHGSAGAANPRAGAGRTAKRRNHHPTVKSTDLMRWLVRLVTPPDGIVLDPFAGSGSTGVACSAEGMRFIGIELSEEYAEIARARIVGDAPLLNMGGMR